MRDKSKSTCTSYHYDDIDANENDICSPPSSFFLSWLRVSSIFFDYSSLTEEKVAHVSFCRSLSTVFLREYFFSRFTSKKMSESISPLYVACRDGCLSIVQQLVPHFSLDEINRVEPNGSTCLHAACYYNHPEIVQLLLESGAMRTTLNKYGCTPYDEAATAQIKGLFPRSATAVKERFLDESSEQTIIWVSSDDAYRAEHNRDDMARLKNKNVLDAAISILDDARFQTIFGRSKLEYCLKEAIRTCDSSWLIKAYSAETGFYRTINEVLAKGKSNFVWNNPEAFLKFIGCLYQHQSLKKYRYFGESYRGMKLSKEDFENNYQVGMKFLIKPFTSTSKVRSVGEFYASAHFTNDASIVTVLCIYIIPESTATCNEASVALDISSISEYPSEAEVLILPHVSFRVRSIKQLPTEITEIEMEYYGIERRKEVITDDLT